MVAVSTYALKILIIDPTILTNILGGDFLETQNIIKKRLIQHENPDGSIVDVLIGNNTLISDSATIRKGCSFGDNCIVGAYALFGANVTVEDSSIFGNFTSVVRDAKIGNNCIFGPFVKILTKDPVPDNTIQNS